MRLALLGQQYERQIHTLLEQIDTVEPSQRGALVKQLSRPDLSNVYNVIGQLDIDEARWAVMICPTPIITSKDYVRVLFLTEHGGQLLIVPTEQLSGGRDLVFEFFGQIEETDTHNSTSAPAAWTVTNNLDHPPMTIQFWLMRAAAPRSPMVAQLHWKPAFGDQLRRTIEIEGDEWNKKTLERASTTAIRALTFLHGVTTKPGPKIGTVQAQTYKSPEEWHAAIREKILTKQNRSTATDETLAFWVGIGVSTMYRHMKGWGPKKRKDLLNGKF